MNFLKKFGPVIIGCSFLVACSGGKNKLPEGILQPDEMVSILVDVHLAEADAINRKVQPDSVKLILDKHYQSIFQIYKIEKTVFLQSFDYYSKRPEDFDRLYEKVIEQMTLLEEKKLHFN